MTHNSGVVSGHMCV